MTSKIPSVGPLGRLRAAGRALRAATGARIALVGLAAVVSLGLQAPAHAQANFGIKSDLLDAMGNLPIKGLQDALKTAAKSAAQPKVGTRYEFAINGTPASVYIFGNMPQQAVVLAIEGRIDLPGVFNNSAWKRLGGASLGDPIFSLSTVDYDLASADMPDGLKDLVKRSYFGATSLQFKAGFQVAGRFASGGIMKTVLENGFGLPVQNFVMRAGVALPVPTDAQGGASLALTLLSDIKQVGNTIKDLPEFYVELQTEPGKQFSAPMGMNNFALSDATFYLNNQGVVSYTGNLVMNPIGKKFAVFFQTPVAPTGAMDLLDFKFGMAAQEFTLEDYARLVVSVQTAKVAGGGFLKDTSAYQNYLTQLLKPLSVVKIYNPKMRTDYRFGDPARPFPTYEAFNLLVLGPLATTEDANGKTVPGPMLKAMGKARIMGQEIGDQFLYAGPNGLRVNSKAQLALKLGPLGRQSVSMDGVVDISRERQVINFRGNVLGRVLDLNLTPTHLVVDSPATCATPFALSANVQLSPDMNIATVMDGLPGVNVNPAQISGCVGPELKKALGWIASNGQQLGGYSAGEAQGALKKIADEEYRIAKDAAREVAEAATHEGAKQLKSAGNFVKKLFGKKKKKKQEPKADPIFAGSVFDWDFYYDTHQDVVRSGMDLAEHWRLYGINEGRQASPEFDVRYYLANNSDVAKKFGATNYRRAAEHWIEQGIDEGRQGSAQFSVRSYLARYSDLQKAFGAKNWDRAFDHWMESGQNEGRTGAP